MKKCVFVMKIENLMVGAELSLCSAKIGQDPEFSNIQFNVLSTG